MGWREQGGEILRSERSAGVDCPAVPSILFACTGNICRSPMAEGLARALLTERGADVAVRSAGTGAWADAPAEQEAVLAAAERGADISGHRARKLEPSDVQDADVIVCMAAEHVDDVIGLVPEAASQTFRLKELVRLLEELPTVEALPGLQERVRAAEALRRTAPFVQRRGEDIDDPLGMPLDMFRVVAWDIDEWTRRLVVGLLGAGAERKEATG
jgi:protein-tyrosine-phosphatase